MNWDTMDGWGLLASEYVDAGDHGADCASGVQGDGRKVTDDWLP